MLLQRFPVQLVPDTKTKTKQKMTILVSLYRKSVDEAYRKMISQHVSDGKMDEYVGMMIVNLVNKGKAYTRVASHVETRLFNLINDFRYREEGQEGSGPNCNS